MSGPSAMLMPPQTVQRETPRRFPLADIEQRPCMGAAHHGNSANLRFQCQATKLQGWVDWQ